MIVIDPGVWGQILLAVVTGLVGILMLIVRAVVSRMKETSRRELEQLRTKNEIALKEAETRAKELEAKAQERVLAAEADIRSIANQQASIANQQIVLTQLLELLRDSGRRTDEKEKRGQVVMEQLLSTSSASADTLRAISLDMGSVKTNVGEHSIVLEAVRQVVAGLPTQLDSKTNPLTDIITKMVLRVDTVLDGIDEAKKQLVADLIAAIRETLIQVQGQAVTVPHIPIPSIPLVPMETSP